MPQHGKDEGRDDSCPGLADMEGTFSGTWGFSEEEEGGVVEEAGRNGAGDGLYAGAWTRTRSGGFSSAFSSLEQLLIKRSPLTGSIIWAAFSLSASEVIWIAAGGCEMKFWRTAKLVTCGGLLPHRWRPVPLDTVLPRNAISVFAGVEVYGLVGVWVERS